MSAIPKNTMTVAKLKELIADMPDESLVLHRSKSGLHVMSIHDFYQDDTEVYRGRIVLVVRP